MDASQDRRALMAKYGDRREIAEYDREVPRGLRPAEEAFISRHLSKGLVLDVGCASGREAIALARKRFDVVALDLTPAMVLAAKENSKLHGLRDRIRFEVGDVRDMDFPDGTFDSALILGNMIEHVRGREERVRALAETGRVLKPGGILIFSTHTRASRLRYRLYWALVNGWRVFMSELAGKPPALELGDRYIGKISRARTPGKVFIHIYTLEEALEDVRRAGLELLESRCDAELAGGFEDVRLRRRAAHVLYAARRSPVSELK